MLDKYDEFQFINRIPGITTNPIGFVMECPYCHEGKSQGHKQRGYLIINDNRKNYNYFLCHNCSKTNSIKGFLKDHFPWIYDEYTSKEKTFKFDKVKSGNFGKKLKLTRPTSSNILVDEPVYIQLEDKFLPIKENEKAVQYCKKRKIPNDIIDTLYYAPNNLTIKKEGKVKPAPYRNMVIFPFYNGKKIYGWQGRHIETKFFHTRSEIGWKIYNIFNIDNTKSVPILESIIDSLFISNSISCLGSDLNIDLLNRLNDPIFMFDNDETGKKKALKYAKKGYKIFIWPKHIKVKDVNKCIIEGVFTTDEIGDIIKDNTFGGLEAEVRIRLFL